MTTALYRRYRPESFAEMIGQSQVTDPLMTALRADRVGHAYLFSGPRGCGKTTSARILARCLNCAEGPTDTPCGVCDSCVELSRSGGGSLDVVEIDAASHNGVDDARDLRERAIFAPARDRFKIFILDEAHMVTQQGFNALLKLVEEPPEHVKFIFATTEPEKVLGTIRSRTHHYPFRLVPPAAMLEYVGELCRQEGVTVDPGVLPLVVRAGGGSPRDTLSLLNQLIAGSENDAVSYERAVALLGYTHAELLDEVVDAFAAGDAANAFAAVDRVIQTGQDPRRFVDDLLERIRDLIVIAATGPGASAVLRGVPADELERMSRQAQVFGGAKLSRTADLVSAALDDMTGATSPRLHLELMIARVLSGTGGSFGGAGTVPVQGAAVQGAAVQGVPAQGAPVQASAPVPTPAAAPETVASAAPEPSPTAASEPKPTPAPTSESASEAEPASEPTGASASGAAPAPKPEAVAAVPELEPEAEPRASAAAPDTAAEPAPVLVPAPEPEPVSAVPAAAPDVSAPDVSAPVSEVVAPAAVPAAAPVEAPVASGPVNAQRMRDAWTEVLGKLEGINRSSWLIASNARVLDYDDEVLTLAFQSQADVAKFKQLKAGAGPSEDLRSAILTVLGVRVKYLARHDAAARRPEPAADSAPEAPGPAWRADAPAPTAPADDGWYPSDVPPDDEGPDRSAQSAPARAADPRAASPAAPPRTGAPAPAAAPRGQGSAGYAAAPITDWAVAPIPGGAAPLAVDDEPEDAEATPPARPHDGDVAPAQADDPDGDADDAAINATGPARPVVSSRPIDIGSGQQRYGEAVVRQVLGATFVREESYEPPTRFS